MGAGFYREFTAGFKSNFQSLLHKKTEKYVMVLGEKSVKMLGILEELPTTHDNQSETTILVTWHQLTNQRAGNKPSQRVAEQSKSGANKPELAQRAGASGVGFSL